MADQKVSQLPAILGANTAAGDLIYIVDISEPLPADQSKKITLTEFQSAPVSAGTANGVLFLNGSKVVTSGSGLVFDSSGNLGLGVTPSAWVDDKAVQLPQGSVSSGYEYGISVAAGAYRTTSNVWNYTQSAAGVSRFNQVNGAHQWYTAPSGTAGNAISFSQVMELDASGNLGLGVTPSAWNGLKSIDVFGSTAGSFASSNGSASISINAYYNGTNWIYKGNGFATRYEQLGGGGGTSSHSWHTAAVSGTAGNAISFTQALTLTASGRLGIGTTSPTDPLSVSGSTGTLASFTNGATADFSIICGSSITSLNAGGANILAFQTGGTERARITSAGGIVVGTAALATSATDGFLYVPTCAGTPTGTPTTQTGTAPIVVDTTNNKLYFYSGGQWRDAGP